MKLCFTDFSLQLSNTDATVRPWGLHGVNLTATTFVWKCPEGFNN